MCVCTGRGVSCVRVDENTRCAMLIKTVLLNIVNIGQFTFSPRQWYSYVNRFERGRCCGHPNSDRRDRFHGSSLAEILFLYCSCSEDGNGIDGLKINISVI